MEPMALLICAALTLVAAWVVAQPLLVGPAAALAAPGDDEDPARLLKVEKEILYQTLHELDLDYAGGKLSEGDYRALRAKQEAQAVELLKALDAAGATAPHRPAAPQPRSR
jgi:hypothetical protein